MTETAIVGQVDATEPVITFEGRAFRVAEKFGLMPLMRLAYVSKGGMATDDMESLAVIYDVLRQAIHENDWEAFCDHATETRADADDLMPALQDAVRVISERPTRRPSDSSAGPSTTEQNSSVDSSSLESSDLTPRQLQRLEQAPHLRPVEDYVAGVELMSGTG